MQEKEENNLDLEFVFNEFSTWFQKRISSSKIVSKSADGFSDDPIFDQLISLKHRIWDTKQLTYISGRVPKWFHPLFRFFRRKTFDRSICDIQYANVDALIHITQLINDLRKTAHDRGNAIEEKFRNDFEKLCKQTIVLNETVESLASKSKELYTHTLAAINNSEQVMGSKHAELISSLNETRENLRENVLHSTSALRREMMASERLLKTSLKELRENELADFSDIQKKVVSQTKEIEKSVDKILKKGSNALSEVNVNRVMTGSYYERMRGSSALLNERFENRYQILEQILGSKRTSGKLRCLDLGCGTGEWLEVLSGKDHEVEGIDGDDSMTEVCLEKGFEVKTGDVIESISAIPNNSFDLISLFHVIEHLDIETICTLLAEISRIGRPGFNLVFEIPNIHNPFIGSSTFYLDPTHRTKLPLEFIEHLLEVFDYDFIHARFLERNPAHASLFGGGDKSLAYDERFDHMELFVIAKEKTFN